MSAPATCSPLELKVAIAAYVHSLRNVYVYLIVTTVLGTLLVPFLFALFWFSSPRQSWRSPIFICVVLSVVTAIAYACAEIALQMRILFQTPGHFRNLVVAISFLQDGANFFADLALLFRMLAVYPRTNTPRWKRAAIIAPAIALKVIRVMTCIVLAFDQPTEASDSSFVLSPRQRVYMVLGRFATAADNAYASAFFLIKLRHFVHTKEDLGRVSTRGTDTFTSRITHLFWLALSSFIIPVPIVIAQAGLTLAHSVQSLPYFMLQDAATFTSAVCVAFATIWMSSTAQRSGASPPSSPVRHSRLEFARTNAPQNSCDLSRRDSYVGVVGVARQPRRASPIDKYEVGNFPLPVGVDHWPKEAA